MKLFKINAVLAIAALFMLPSVSEAGELTIGDLKVMADTLWVIVAGILVLFMNTGFAMLEAGLCRAKNTVNILSKNVIVLSVSSIIFWAFGFAIMFGDGSSIIGTSGFFMGGADNSPMLDDAYKGVYSSIAWTSVPLWAKYFFQMVFAATAATIVSGTVAERIKYLPFMVFSVVLVGVIYPVVGHWTWGGGFLSGLGFADFAGSTVVHSTGGWAALTGALVLGARKGKFNKEGKPLPLPGHSMSMATLGALILWLGWFGFNAGSTMGMDTEAVSLIIVNTNLAAAAGVIVATFVAMLKLGKPDLSMALNGALAGLVAITAGCDGVTAVGAITIGAIGGFIVVFSILFFDRIRVDDPVGALSVHLVNGIWGTMAVGLFNTGTGLLYGHGITQLIAQFYGVAAVGLFVTVASYATWMIIKMVMGVRVSEEEEILGLDIGEHGMEAYPDFSKKTVL